jgi:Family of unknown function (DUF6847)
MKIAEGLLLRKQLQSKVEQLQPLHNVGERGVFDQAVKRVNVNENLDEITITTPRITLADITKTYDHYASELRKLDSAIQQANWEYDLKYAETPPPKEPKAKKDDK